MLGVVHELIKNVNYKNDIIICKKFITNKNLKILKNLIGLCNQRLINNHLIKIKNTKFINF